MEFEPFDSGATYSDLGNSTSTLSRFPTSATGLQAIVHLPSGALVTGVDLNFCDTNASADVGLLVYTGLSDGTGNTVIGTLSSNGASGGCGSEFADLSAAGLGIDNSANQLFLYASFGALDGTNSISGAIVHYQLQVSPAPGTATFADVPTSHPFFQYIEALADAGITAGCGADSCPDAPLTRRQMAVFLAKGLGLQWP